MIYFTSAFEWKMLADTLKDILTDCYFVFSPTSITMNNVDPEKVLEIYYAYYPDKDHYSCNQTFTFPVYIQTVYRVLRGVKPADSMEMSDLEDGSLHMKIFSDAGVLKNEISLKPLQQEMPTFIRNPRQYDIDIKFNSDQLYHIFHDLSAISRQISIVVKDHQIIFQSQDESGTTSQHAQVFPNIDAEYMFRSKYLVKFLEKFTKPGLDKFVDVRISRQLPLSVVYYLERGSLELTIAGLE
jgi:hypothetical protein